jgi:hypothetical protein
MKLFPKNQPGRSVIGLCTLALILLGQPHSCSGGCTYIQNLSDNCAFSYNPSSYAVALGSAIPVVVHAQGVNVGAVVVPWYDNTAPYTPSVGFRTSGSSNLVTSSQLALPWNWGRRGICSSRAAPQPRTCRPTLRPLTTGRLAGI